jgi:2-polyprenyl-6-methoxyphenol hydroxylase-like FAD-dependent oxidoreductase
MDTEVLIVGAGPVGLALSIDLGKRGIKCILIEKNDAPLGYPKMERCNPRTMEIFRRLGLADAVRAAGYPPDWPMDTYLVFDLMRPPLFKMAHPTVAQAKAKRDATADGSLPLEPYQIVSQYTLEPLLKSVVERIPNVAVKFGHELLSFAQDSGGVTAQVRKTEGTIVSIRAKYIVGCDGGSSVVRKQLGFKMEGEPHLLEMRQALFHCPELYDKVRAPRARHYHRLDDHWTLMIVQDSRQHFTLHAVVDKDEDMAALFAKIVGTPVKFEMLHCAKMGAAAPLGGAVLARPRFHRRRRRAPRHPDWRSRHEYRCRRRNRLVLEARRDAARGRPEAAAVLRRRAATDRCDQRQSLRRRHCGPDEMARGVSSEYRRGHGRGQGCLG